MFNESQLNIHHSSSNSVDISSIQEYSKGEEYEVIDGYDDIVLDEDFAIESEKIDVNKRLSRTNGHATPYFGLCCMNEKVELPVLKLALEILQDFHFKDDDMSRYFKKNIRLFNSIFSFTSMAGRINNNINNGTAPPTFLLSGQNYHCVGSLLPSANNSLKFAQLYIYHSNNEVENRINAVRDIIIESRSSQLKRIDVLHPQYLALQYPLLFPSAEDGYRIGIETSYQYNTDGSKKRKTISIREFFSYRLQMQFPDYHILLHSG
ncbi:hypothetical protein Ahy_A09g042591 [Arachis hypogaea]|uniref:Helitron helicase-like domain-containing protein n=1 Tax=Arachis hypogaea TaxID=3818 RepID=A0A445BGA5_ARAHY|nr:hypothetical protein Ahy_A09g042591 [Arachis hypogaea]